MAKIILAMGSAKPVVMKSESKGKGKARSPRQVFMSELMKRISGDGGNQIAEAFVKNDHKRFRSMMIKVISDMAQVEDAAE